MHPLADTVTTACRPDTARLLTQKYLHVIRQYMLVSFTACSKNGIIITNLLLSPMLKNTLRSSASYTDTKPHYELLDGLRGVAALIVVCYHVFEGFAFSSGSPVIFGINHGYLAVDFFFILSGFVIGYAYDDRWGKTLTLRNFFKRRLIRLHPLVILGAVIGVISFTLQGSVQWDGTHIATSAVMWALLMAMFMLPATPGCGYEVRGNGEMFPLNGPSWSLFFEYIGNILYALVLRRLSTKALFALVCALGLSLVAFACLDVSTYGSIGVGWTLDTVNFLGGSLRMLFPFSTGLLLSRVFKPFNVRGAFWICTFVLVVLFNVPFISGSEPICMNGLFESFCILIVFPVLIMLGASGRTTDAFSTRVCKTLGDLSFPLYIVHYPVMYYFYAWMMKTGRYTLADTWPIALCVVLGNVILAWVCLKCYDEPVRRWLTKKFGGKRAA